MEQWSYIPRLRCDQLVYSEISTRLPAAAVPAQAPAQASAQAPAQAPAPAQASADPATMAVEAGDGVAIASFLGQRVAETSGPHVYHTVVAGGDDPALPASAIAAGLVLWRPRATCACALPQAADVLAACFPGAYGTAAHCAGATVFALVVNAGAGAVTLQAPAGSVSPAGLASLIVNARSSRWLAFRVQGPGAVAVYG